MRIHPINNRVFASLCGEGVSIGVVAGAFACAGMRGAFFC